MSHKNITQEHLLAKTKPRWHRWKHCLLESPVEDRDRFSIFREKQRRAHTNTEWLRGPWDATRNLVFSSAWEVVFTLNRDMDSGREESRFSLTLYLSSCTGQLFYCLPSSITFPQFFPRFAIGFSVSAMCPTPGHRWLVQNRTPCLDWANHNPSWYFESEIRQFLKGGGKGGAEIEDVNSEGTNKLIKKWKNQGSSQRGQWNWCTERCENPGESQWWSES